MIKHLACFCLLSLSLGFIAPAKAAPPEPALTVRVASVNHIVDHFEYFGSLFDQKDIAQMMASFVKELEDPKKGIEGIDPNRPIGLYGVVTPDIADSYPMLVIPIADEERFIDLLSGKLSLDPRKGNDGTYFLEVPDLPVPVLFRFANKSAYATLAITDTTINADKLLPPEKLFGNKTDAVVAADLDFKKVPDQLKKVFIGQFELQMEEAKQFDDPGLPPTGQKVRNLTIDILSDMIISFMTETDALRLRLNVDMDKDDIAASLILDPKAGTPAAKFIQATAGYKGLQFDFPDSNTMSGQVRFTVPEPIRKKLNPLLNELVEEAQGGLKPEEQFISRLVWQTFKNSIYSGVFDMAGSLEIRKQADLDIVLGVTLREDGQKVEQLINQFAPLIPKEELKLETDVKTLNGVKVHKATELQGGMKREIGSDTAWIGTAKDKLLMTMGKAGEQRMEDVAKLNYQEVPIMSLRIPVTSLILFEENPPPGFRERAEALIKQLFEGDATGKDLFELRLTGGEALELKARVNGKAIGFLAGMDN